ncbi:hypothetical protein AC739_11860 [Planococcus glaciei]|uniref:DUF3934 domain-containing protein n=1 Tax=Planococcus TaxID=1372 RepID=UPI00069EF859|nr:DUF3934 domain-containing protein [Planococcus glaciei]KOF09957.1 hypothetical protein AC739_11860 [Planococcus glaciei]
MPKKDKAKSGIGQGTGKKGWTRWQTGAKKAKNAKPYTSKNKKANDLKNKNQPKDEGSGWVDVD